MTRPIDRLSEIVAERYKNFSRFSKALGKSAGFFGPYKSGLSNLGEPLLKEIEDRLGINSEYLQTGEGEPFVAGGGDMVREHEHGYKVGGGLPGEIITDPSDFPSDAIEIEFVMVPILEAKVFAGTPTEYFESFTEKMPIPRFIVGGMTAGVITVQGDSMEPTYQDGDTLIIAKKEPKEGDIVVAALENKWTLKELRYFHGTPMLVPHNKDGAHKVIPCDNELMPCDIIGVVLKRMKFD